MAEPGLASSHGVDALIRTQPRRVPGTGGAHPPASTPFRVSAPAVAHGVPISEASRVLGVPMPTLRSWERRYGVPAPRFPAGRHRRYSPADLHLLRLMRDEVARGHRPSLAADTVRRLAEATPGRPPISSIAC